MLSTGIAATRGISASGQGYDSRDKVKSAASDFEALLLTQMMKSARETASSSLPGTDETESCDSIMDFAEQQFGAIMARAGGLGIAKLVVSGLTHPSATGEADVR